MSKKHKKPSPANTGNQIRPGGSPVSRPAPAPMEESEPIAQRRPVPLFLIVLLVALLYVGDMYVMEHGGDVLGKNGAFPKMVFDPYRTYEDLIAANPVNPLEEARRDGMKVFNLTCVACHQASGQGVAGQFPPLAGSDWVNTEGANRLIRIPLNGATGPWTVNGVQFNNNMPPWKDNLSDEQIAHVLTYIRSEWGNKAPPVSADDVKKIRAQIGDRSEPNTEEELKKLPEKVE